MIIVYMKYSKPLIFGLFLALVDVIVLSLLKLKYIGTLNTWWVFVIAFIVYGLQPIVFYNSLKYSSLTAMNLLWDVTSDILVTMVGFLIFREAITQKQAVGVIFAFIAILLLK